MLAEGFPAVLPGFPWFVPGFCWVLLGFPCLSSGFCLAFLFFSRIAVRFSLRPHTSSRFASLRLGEAKSPWLFRFPEREVAQAGRLPRPRRNSA